MYEIKREPEDFIVKELSNARITEHGRYCYHILKKTSYTTQKAIETIARSLNIKTKNIGYAGQKDKHAITTQLISIKDKAVKNLKLKDISLRFVGRGDIPISLGDLSGNVFEITIRNISNEDNPKGSFCIPNYFDEQRFSKNNLDIGIQILKRQFSKACELIDDKRVEEHLRKKKNDFVGAFKRLPIKIQMIYISSVQSFIYNETLNEYLSVRGNAIPLRYSRGVMIFLKDYEHIDNIDIPMVGFDTEIENDEIKDIIERKLDKIGIGFRDFIIKQLPDLTVESCTRPMLVKIENLKINSLKKDELNKNMKKAKVTFSLPRSSYATIAIKQMMLHSHEKLSEA